MIIATKYNLASIDDAIDSLINNKRTLVDIVKQYPLQIDILDKRFTVVSENDIDKLIANLQQEVSDFNNSVEKKFTIKFIIEVECQLKPHQSTYNLTTLLEDRIARSIQTIDQIIDVKIKS